MKMPFGKFKNRDIDDLPSDYLKWVAGHVDDENICCAADEEYQYRTDNNIHWYED